MKKNNRCSICGHSIKKTDESYELPQAYNGIVCADCYEEFMNAIAEQCSEEDGDTTETGDKIVEEFYNTQNPRAVGYYY